jgi:hypothetical protein
MCRSYLTSCQTRSAGAWCLPLDWAQKDPRRTTRTVEQEASTVLGRWSRSRRWRIEGRRTRRASAAAPGTRGRLRRQETTPRTTATFPDTRSLPLGARLSCGVGGIASAGTEWSTAPGRCVFKPGGWGLVVQPVVQPTADSRDSAAHSTDRGSLRKSVPVAFEQFLGAGGEVVIGTDSIDPGCE